MLRTTSKTGLIFALLLILVLTPMAAEANVPTVVSIDLASNREQILIRIAHANPSQSHYVDKVDVKVDGSTTTLEEIGIMPQTGPEFVVSFNLPKGDTHTVQARAQCIVHGWGDWSSVMTIEPSTTPLPTPSPSPTPEPVTPWPVYGGIAAIVVIVAIVALYIARKSSKS